MKGSSFIRPIHPKAEISPDQQAIAKVLRMGWWGQLKIHGHRVQIHIHADPQVSVLCYTRQGRLHTVHLDEQMLAELRRIFQPSNGWTVVDGEWLKKEKKICVFDLLKKDDQLLISCSYSQRYQQLPREFISPYFEVLPVLKTITECMDALDSERSSIEGLVFKSPDSIGFHDSSIVKCRKTQYRY